ncbi:hypothetical protein QTN47_12425 [Danxiaibacter flavus]|uniref:DUF4239 domain-containing protein n=1 Tax=Danxiaibacter flavus TaxID=3049108 RepID=A0ABV3ZFE1_9BACT|nr:hypothetical protein QNM32_12430 [Chitinophagaceae bacterium DXS]
MKYSLLFRTDAWVLCLFLFVGCIFMVSLGKLVQIKFFSHDVQESRGGVNSLLGALFGLWGFMLAFTFSQSSARFDNVRTIMVDESNVIRNTILRVETFPDSIRTGLRPDMQKYLEAQIDYYKYAADLEKFIKAKQTTEDVKKQLWMKTIAASHLPNMGITSANMLASLTGMYDIASKRDALLLSDVPELVVYMLFFLALCISFIGGFTTPANIKPKEWLVIVGFLLLASIIIYITFDLARPLRGFIKPTIGIDRLAELRKLM